MSAAKKGRRVSPLRSWTGLRRLSPALVAAGNRVFAASGAAGPETATAPLRIGFRSRPIGPVVAMTAPGGPIHVVTGIAPAANEGPAWHHYPESESRLLAWSLAAGERLSVLETLLGGSVQATALLDAPASDDDAIWLDVRVPSAGDGGDLLVPVALNAEQLHQAASRPRAADAVVGRRRAAWLNLPVTLGVRLAGPALSVADVRGLEPDDVIVLGNRAQIATTSCRLLHPGTGLRWQVRIHDDGAGQVTGIDATIPEPDSQETARVNDEATAPETSDASETPAPEQHPADRLPIQVEFDLGHLSLTLGELAGIEPGYVFQLPQALEQARVTVRLNGSPVGTGELVAIGDVLGVRLTAWNHGSGHD